MDQFSIPGVLHTPVAARPHLLDITMFWSPRSGAFARYLRSKRDWLTRIDLAPYDHGARPIDARKR